MANPKGTPQNLIPGKKGDPRTLENMAKARAVAAENRKHKMDAQKAYDLFFDTLCKKMGKGDATGIEELDNLKDTEGLNMRAIEQGFSKFAIRFASGDKRAFSQFMEMLAMSSEGQKRGEADNGLADAINNAVAAWKNE